ncbi:HutD family protein [Nakamurella flava]|uniref:HutD family protein n=1 Tax=Nakamurella flava TaxID=2576308 RepID=A0A4U6QCH6_9ACTN|nr:HutD family protein [Nakamurella flava]TKV57753.1 HutD family protein [Nakamurella flava]
MTARPLVRFRDRRPQPWANGLGSTTELLGWSDGPGLFGSDGPAWRLSIARLDGPAPFSPLPGVDRHFLPIGADVRLRIAGADIPVPAGQVCRFSGKDVVELLDLTSAPAFAVNLMVRASGGGPELVMADSHDPRCAAAIAALTLTPGGGFGRFDIVRPHAGLASGPALPLALVLPGAAPGPTMV